MRGLLAGPGAFIVALLLTFGGALFLPASAAGDADGPLVPAALFSAVWVTVVLYALLEPRLPRAGLVLLALVLVNGVFVAAHWLTRLPAA